MSGERRDCAPVAIIEEDVDGLSGSLLEPASWLLSCCWVGWTKAVAWLLLGWLADVGVLTRLELVE